MEAGSLLILVTVTVERRVRGEGNKYPDIWVLAFPCVHKFQRGENDNQKRLHPLPVLNFGIRWLVMMAIASTPWAEESVQVVGSGAVPKHLVLTVWQERA